MLLIVPCAFGLVGCGGDPGEPPTREELATIYKEIAVSTWEKLGLDDPTAPALASGLAAVPDKKVETQEEHQVQNIQMNANTMAGLMYMVSLLYSNENFVTTNDIAIFDANVTIMGDQYLQHFVLKTKLDKQNNKLYLETATTVNSVEQYSNVEVDYDFENDQLISYRFYANILDSFVDMSLTAQNKYMWYECEGTTDTFAAAVLAQKAEFKQSAEAVEQLTSNFDTEIQTYMAIVEECAEEIRNSSN